PMPKVVVHMIASETMNAAIAANTGWQRDVIHSRIGNSTATGATGSHGSGGSKTMMMVVAADTTRAMTPSRASLPGGGSRRALTTPISSGATVMMPMASDANQCHQVVQIGAVGLWNNL